MFNHIYFINKTGLVPSTRNLELTDYMSTSKRNRGTTVNFYQKKSLPIFPTKPPNGM